MRSSLKGAAETWCVGGGQALKYGALSANISSQEPIDVVMHESHDGHQTLWDNYKQVGHWGPLTHSHATCCWEYRILTHTY